jgi:hypothetical protein
MDIIKNKMLANLEKQHKMNIDDAYEDWQAMLEFLPEYKDQERFLRHYYNAFKVYPDKRIERYTRATKSNLITIFEQYIKKNAKDIFDDLLLKAESYNYLIEPEEYEENRQTKALIDLRRIGAAPSYLLLLYLYSIDVEYFSDKTNTLNEVLEFLVKYYVRRNITDIPNTRDLDGINIDVIEHCQNAIDSEKKLTSELIIEKLMTGKEKPASINKLKEGIEDNLFYYNAGMARYVLSKLDEISHSREYKPDLWARNDKGLLVWTVEHVFPQGNNIPDYWVDMIADGNKEKAEEIHEEWVHCLGNLTLSGYNSKLSNSSFEEKQSLHENKKFLGYKINIGYKNGLSLNDLKFDCNGALTSLANIETWTQKSIECRNDTMTNILLKLFSFTDDEISEIEIDE